MGWFLNALNSSIGKKILMAVTGVCLMLFLIIHLINNLSLFGGPQIFNTVVKNLDTIKPLVRVIEVILLLIFVFHIYDGIRLWYENKKARPVKYKINASSENTNIFSRTMIWSGSIIFIFLIIHLKTFWIAFNFGHPLALSHNYYQILVEAFSNPVYSLFYVIAMILLGFHLMHGFQSAFQTFGWNNRKYFPIIQKLGLIYTLIMVIGFSSIPIYFLFFYGGN
ncbi:MAG: succinate dehydrogenase cytochrome b subunit [Melioribacter sp.]|uniref:succinate dehydrogenase cytochrome b subunit n=1 Tax=Rosettibacter primus TaxID=3111523 RepID=UPI00247EAFFF|nr:succinate dehydrogenase cytochrome b subunit [Melioribacter sp.]